ncbi:MAG: tetratricopeptide repeat protein [Ignavibacteria bacterium]
MEKIPTGSVTFLFTDIEGSTRLAQEFPNSYNSILQKHDSILDKAIESHNGFVFKKIGDAFCSGFESSSDAIAAAHEIQKKLAEHEWDKFHLKVRIGLHRGEAEYLNDDYAGYITLSRVSRIMSVANGGQVLLTQEVYNDAGDLSLPGISFRDLGERKLKDIILPEHIYQLVSNELQSDFPQLKSLDIRPNNLPLQITKFIGREREIAEIKNLLTGTRKLTIVGSGGTGKTRLAIRAATDLIDEFENGVWFVELSALNDPELIEKEISIALNLKEEGDKNLIDILKEYLEDKQLLIIFDNSEHLLDKCAEIAYALLQRCPKLKIISTSRESLNISGEKIYRVPPLSVPDNSTDHTPESLKEYESSRLFIERASSIKHDFKVTDENADALAELCRKLDGIPFAIELAATRVNVLSIDKILDRLNDRFKLLTRGSSTALPRHQTLRALIDWSYDMLNENEKLLLQRLSIFMGGWAFEAAEQICSDETIDEIDILDLLTSLESKSLITVNEVNGNVRYNMLETIKQYCSEKLEEKSGVYKKHFEYYINTLDPAIRKEKKTEQKEWVGLLESELDNLRVAIQWTMENEPENTFRLITSLRNFWLIKAFLREGFQTCRKALAIETVTDKKLRAEVLLTAAEMCYGLGNFSELENYANESLTLFTEVGDKAGIAECLIKLGDLSYTNLEFKKSRDYFDKALVLSEEINSKELKATILRNLSFLVNQDGDKDGAYDLKEQSLIIFREIKDSYNVASVLASLGIFEYHRGNFERANSFSEESLSIARENGDQYFISINLINLGRIYSEKKDFLKAEYSLEEAIKLIRKYGYSLNLHPALIYLARILKSKRDFERSVQTYNEFLAGSSKSGGNFFLKSAYMGLTECYINIENYEQAVRNLSYMETASIGSEVKLTDEEINITDNYKKTLREKLGNETFDLYWNEGKQVAVES